MRRSPALLVSCVAHVLFLYVAFYPRSGIPLSGGDIGAIYTPTLERIRFIEIAPPAPPTDVVEPSTSPAKRVATAMPVLPRIQSPIVAPIAVSGTVQIPDIDFSSKATGVDSTAPATTARIADLVHGLVANTSSGTSRAGPYTKADVDKVVVPYSNNPRPSYPWGMQRQGIEASFVAQFVVDSTGRVDETTLVFPPTARSQFTDEVRRTLRRSRYYPAEVAGQRVMQLVEQRFTFVLLNGRGESR